MNHPFYQHQSPFSSRRNPQHPQQHFNYNSTDPPKYCLTVRQQPQKSRLCSFKDKVDRRPLDPPPIVQLYSSNTLTFNDYHISANFFLHCTLVNSIDQSDTHCINGNRTTAGSVVQSLHKLKDTNNAEGAFFIFADISIRIEGIFKLRFTLFQIKGMEVERICSVYSDPFQVYSPKTFPGMSESTELTRVFSDQGVRIRIRKEARAATATTPSMKRRRGMDQQQQQEEDEQPPTTIPKKEVNASSSSNVMSMQNLLISSSSDDTTSTSSSSRILLPPPPMLHAIEPSLILSSPPSSLKNDYHHSSSHYYYASSSCHSSPIDQHQAPPPQLQSLPSLFTSSAAAVGISRRSSSNSSGTSISTSYPPPPPHYHHQSNIFHHPRNNSNSSSSSSSNIDHHHHHHHPPS